jgi:Raf kinase inhibitor-like YbhB/YbcL family protein
MLIVAAGGFSEADANASLTLTSPTFKSGAAIPERFTCSGSNESPALEWRAVPDGTRSLALVLEDPDAPMGPFVHWVVYNISPAINGLPEGLSPSAAGSEQGLNGMGKIGYTGPCPPPGTPHHYHFRLYALDQKLELKRGATLQGVEDAMKGHVLERSELVGIFGR